MITAHVQAIEGVTEPQRILIEPEISMSSPMHEQAESLLSALEKGLNSSVLVELGKLISIYHPA